MEVYQALTLMFMFGMFILALLTYVKKKQITLELCNSMIYFSNNRAVPLWERLLCRP